MITREQLKTEIDSIDLSLVDALYRIVVATKGEKRHVSPPTTAATDRVQDLPEWQAFITRTAGSLVHTPILREEQGEYEVREDLL